MHKRLYLILSVLTGIITVLLIGSTLLPILKTTFPFNFFVTNYLSLIILVLCSKNLKENDESKLNRIIPIIIIICMFATIIDCHILDIKGLSAKGTVIGTAANVISSFLTSCYAFILPLVLLKGFDIEDNKINKILKKIAYATLVITALATFYIMIKVESISVLTNLFNYVAGDISTFKKETVSNYNLLITGIGLEFGTMLSMYFLDFALYKGKKIVKMSDLEKQNNMNMQNQAAVLEQQKQSDYFAGPGMNMQPAHVQMNMGNELMLNSNVGQVDKPMAEGQSNVEITPQINPVQEQPKVEVQQKQPNEVQATTPTTPTPAPEVQSTPAQTEQSPVVNQGQPAQEQKPVVNNEPAPIKMEPVINEAVANQEPINNNPIPEVKPVEVTQPQVTETQTNTENK